MKLEHKRNGFCLACAFHHARAFAILLAPLIASALGIAEYEHVHTATTSTTIVVTPASVSSSSPWQNWPCDLSARARAREAPDLVDVCQS